MPRILNILCTAIFYLQVGYTATFFPTRAENGLVVSAGKLASEAGVEIMKKGGNAVDAAVATGFVLAVTYPQAGNIGGGGFMVVYLANGESFTIDFRETAPANARHNMYLNNNGEVIEGLSLYSHLAVGVPGTVDGLLKVWEDYGSGNISRRKLLSSAIRLAEKGFPITHRLAQKLNNYHDFFAKDDGAKTVFIRKDGRLWKEGDLLIQKDLAKTLKLISRKGRRGFYEGKVAEYIEKEMKEGHGLINKNDLSGYKSVYRSPVIGNFRKYEIISMGPPSSGGALLIQMFNMLEHFPIDTMGWNSSDYIHILTEVERRAYADRAEHMSDPDFWDVPLDMLISPAYALKRIQDITIEKATPSTEVYAGNPAAYESRETAHFSVVDKDGNCVSLTTTLNTSFGCGVLVEGAGFFLNNEMDDFAAKPGVPNYYGLVSNESSAIQPGKRPLSSMTPTIVLKNGQPFMVIGSPGGASILTTVMQVILNVVIHGMNIQEAISVPRIHSQWLPDAIFVEPRSLSRDVERNLLEKGHNIQPYPLGTLGSANGIIIKADGIYGGADPRRENSATGY